MSEESNNQNIIVGAAVVAGILGTLSALMRSHYSAPSWTDQARDAAGQVFDRGGDMVNKNMLLGGVAGGLIGAATALLLAPKAGSELMQDIAETISHPGELVHSTSRRSSSSRSRSSSRRSSRSKKAASAAGKERGESSSEGNSRSRRSSSSRKKSPARRRTATAAHKASTSEKAGETAGATA